MDIVSSRKPFNLGADITKKNPELFSDFKSDENKVKFYAWDGVPICKYTREDIISNKTLLNSYKVFISKTGDPYMRNGRINKYILRSPFLGEPLSACSETYLSIGQFNNEFEAQAIINDFVSKNPDLIMIKNLEKYFE